MGIPWAVVRIANAVTNLALLAGIPRPPYNRGNALIVETIGRRSGKRRRIPVGYLDDGGRCPIEATWHAVQKDAAQDDCLFLLLAINPLRGVQPAVSTARRWDS